MAEISLFDNIFQWITIYVIQLTKEKRGEIYSEQNIFLWLKFLITWYPTSSKLFSTESQYFSSNLMY